MIAFSSCIFLPIYFSVLSILLKLSAGEACLFFLLAVVALLITADLIMVTVLKPFRQLLVCVKSEE